MASDLLKSFIWGIILFILWMSALFGIPWYVDSFDEKISTSGFVTNVSSDPCEVKVTTFEGDLVTGKIRDDEFTKFSQKDIVNLTYTKTYRYGIIDVMIYPKGFCPNKII